jgi:GNAT superfamily N-acetyltransferase
MINIRKATPEDAPTIVDFQKRMAWETEKLELATGILTGGVREVFANQVLGQYWVAEEKEIIVASLLITPEWSDWRNSMVWWLQSVYVLPAYRRRGIFKAMYDRIVHEASLNNVAGIRLYVESNNSPARKTYESLGMKSDHYTMYEWLKE